MAGQAVETAAQRYARDWTSTKGNRKVRTLDMQASERRNRNYVDRTTRATAVVVGDVTSIADYKSRRTVPYTPA